MEHVDLPLDVGDTGSVQPSIEHPIAKTLSKRGGLSKRRYVKAAASVKVAGKTYKGTEIARDGKFLVLKTAKGSVFVNLDAQTLPVEVVGVIGGPKTPSISPQNGSGGPIFSGGRSAYMADRNRALEALTAMPAGIPVE